MSEEKELQESEIPSMESDDISSMVDFADLSDLENISNMDVFGELGDVTDLGDIPDLSEDITLGDMSSDSGMDVLLEEIPDVSLDDMLGEDISSDPGMDSLTDDTMDVSQGDMPEADISDDIGMDALPEEIPDVSLDDMLGEDALGDFDIGNLPELTAEDAPGGDTLPDEESAGLDIGSLQDLTTDSLPDEDILANLGMDALSEESPDLSMDDMAGEDASSDLGMDALTEDIPDLSIDDMADGDALDDSGIDALTEDLSMDDMAAEDALSDIGTDILAEDTPDLSMDDLAGGEAMADSMPDMALDDLSISEDGLLGDMDIDLDALGTTPEQDGAEGEDLGNMLDGLLDDLDMNGTIEETPIAGDSDSQDDVADLLGLDDAFFGGDENASEGEDSLDMMDVSDMVPEDSPEQEEKKPGFFKRVFGNVVTDEIAEQEREAARLAEEEAEKQAEEDAKQAEEKEALKAEKKAEKEAKAAAKKKQKEALKAEKAQQKAEKKAKEEEEAAAELEIVGKLNKVGVCIIAIATIIFLSVEIVGTNMFGYISNKNEAVRYFEMGKYTEAYQSAVGTSMKDRDSEEYEKIITVMKVQQCLNAYQNYDRMKYYPEALDALLRGIKRYDANIEEGTQLEVDKDMMSCRTQLISLLQSEFNITEAKAYSLLALDREAYQNEVIKIGVEKAK